MFRRILILFALLAVVAAMVPAEAQQYARIINALEYKNQEQARLLNNARGLVDGILGGVLGGGGGGLLG